MNSILKIALRNLTRRFSYSLINIVGLSFGLAACLVIFLFLKHELSFDKFHSQSEQIYRVTRKATISGREGTYARVNYSLTDLIREHVPEIKGVTRFGSARGWINTMDLSKQFEENRIFLAETSFFRVFDVEFLVGNPETALEGPNKMVITQHMAEKYFGESNPLGQVLQMNKERDFVVTGVISEWPQQSHLQFDFLMSLSTTKNNWYSESMFTHWGNIWAHTYVVTTPDVTPEQLEGQITKVAYEYGPPALDQFEMSFPCQPLEDIHLASNVTGSLKTGGSMTFLKVFFAVGLLILLIACFNFVNLATARASWRAKEVSVKKVLGVEKRSLIAQFLGESVIIAFISTVFALLLAAMILPYFAEFTGSDLGPASLLSWDIAWFVLVLMLVVGVSAGAFPATYLSSFKPVVVLKGNSKLGDSKIAGSLRKGLVLLQFTISIALMVGSITVYHQLQFARDLELGLDKEQVVVVRFYNNELREHVTLIKENFLKLSSVTAVSAVSDTPPGGLNSWWMEEKNNAEATKELIPLIAVDHDFVRTMKMNVINGRDFDASFTTDTENAILINETMANYLSLENPVGTVFDMSEGRAEVTVVGIVEDFHFSTVRDEIGPIMMYIEEPWFDHLLVRVAPGNYTATINSLKETWDRVIPDWEFSYRFMDEDFDRAYQAEARLSSMVLTFSMLAIIISILGLVGLANFTAEQKMKEIGVRKVLGAHLGHVVWIQYRTLVVLGAIGLLIATPISYLLLNNWLSQFAYRTELSAWIFILGGALTLFITLGTVSFQSVKAGLKNPVDTLRME
ncbi:MAG: ABC transporter permease [Cytophagales bacterium]|nr:ABC transporter permease [Cytophagales bacterium]